MDNFVFFAGAYIAFIGLLFGYIFYLHRKTKKLESEIEQLLKKE